MQRRKLENLNLLDDFLFGTMVTYPGIGEAFVREILKIIFQKEFGPLTVVPQKVYYGSDTDKHGARLDVYLEETSGDGPGRATVYDMEPDNNSDKQSIAALPKRTRFYHAKIDASSLKAGESYHSLKNVIVIMISPYDPFGRDHMVYTIQNKCLEIPEMPYDDGARTLYLYTKGTKGNPPEALKQLLHYMEHTSAENAKSDVLKSIDKMVRRVKEDGEVSLEYMKIFEREEMLVKQGISQGISQGIIQGQEMERKNTEKERQNAARERQNAMREQQRADVAERRATVAEQELKRLKEELARLKP